VVEERERGRRERPSGVLGIRFKGCQKHAGSIGYICERQGDVIPAFHMRIQHGEPEVFFN
jgi:hypothetical protein